MKDINKIIKVLKYIDKDYTENNGPIDKGTIESFENDANSFDQFYGFVNNIGFFDDQDQVDKIIATFCYNWKLCNGEWDKFLTGELQLIKPKLKNYTVIHDYTATVSITESGDIETYLPSIAKLSAQNFEIDMNITSEDILDMWDSEWHIQNS